MKMNKTLAHKALVFSQELLQNLPDFARCSFPGYNNARIGTDFPKQHTLSSAAEHLDQPPECREAPQSRSQQPLKKARARPPRAPVTTRSGVCHAAAAARRIAAAGDEPARILKERQSS